MVYTKAIVPFVAISPVSPECELVYAALSPDSHRF